MLLEKNDLSVLFVWTRSVFLEYEAKKANTLFGTKSYWLNKKSRDVFIQRREEIKTKNWILLNIWNMCSFQNSSHLSSCIQNYPLQKAIATDGHILCKCSYDQCHYIWRCHTNSFITIGDQGITTFEKPFLMV